MIYFKDLFCVKNLFLAWAKYRRGKTRKLSVVNFWQNIEENIFKLSKDILDNKYEHGVYNKFFVFDIKKREINIPSFRDRIVHQVIFDFLEKVYDKKIFIENSFSSRREKGPQKAIDKMSFFIRDELERNKGRCFVLKCDIKKYFDNIDHNILERLIKKEVGDKEIFSVIQKIISSFERSAGKGIPLGNIISQIFANIYLNELDRFVKSSLKARKYIRYNDDFVIVSSNEKYLVEISHIIRHFLFEKLCLDLSGEKTKIRKISFGVEFLGKVFTPNAIFLRKKTINKMLKNVSEKNRNSYLGLLSRINSFYLKRKILFF